MRIVLVMAFVLATVLALSPGAEADLLSKSYVFKEGVTLELGAATGDGLRVDSVEFKLPEPVGDRTSRVAGLAAVQVKVSNIAEKSRKAGVAVALFDDEGRLLGVASGGTALMTLKSGRQKSYTLVFDDVNSEVHRATKFQISIESKP